MRALRALTVLLCGSLWLLNGLCLAAEPQPHWDDQPATTGSQTKPRADQPPPSKPLADKPLPPRFNGRRAPQDQDPNAPPYGLPQPPNSAGPNGTHPDPVGPFRGGYPGMPGTPGMPGMPNLPQGGPQNWPPGFLGGRDNRRFEELKQYDPEMYELEKSDADLERQTFELSQRFRSIPRDQQEAVKKQIAEVVEKHFDVRQARRQLQLKRLQEELEQLRTAIDRRNQIRAEIVQRRVAELTGQTSELDF